MKSELAYTLSDYYKYEVEPPARILADPETCEGDLMTDEEVYDYCRDSLGVLRILEDRNPTRRAELSRIFLTDCQFLLKIGRIKDSDYESLLREAGIIEP